jgi:hypothetical protein
VLSVEDVAGGKVCALASRVEPRDYADTARMLERYTPAELISFARRLDPGLTDRDFADAGRQLDRMGDERFARYGLSAGEVAVLRERFAAWPGTAAAVVRPAVSRPSGPQFPGAAADLTLEGPIAPRADPAASGTDRDDPEPGQ